MAWKSREKGRVHVELYSFGAIVLIRPDPDELTASESRWVETVALPELRREWAVAGFDMRTKRSR